MQLIRSEYQLMLFAFLAAPILGLSGCIGTDFLEETVDLSEPYVLLSPISGAIEVGQNMTYEAIYYDSTNTPASVTFEWGSSDETIASVSGAGTATGLGPGQVRISAKARGIEREALLTVVTDPGSPAIIDLTPPDSAVTVGSFISYAASVKNAMGDILDDQVITWRTSDPSLAIINTEGIVQTVETGQVQVIASVGDIESAPARLEILAKSRTGAFRGSPGTSYNISGTAFLEQVEGGGLQLRFGENFSSSNGPDLYVYLSTEGKVNATSLQVGQLQSTAGAQTYVVPGNVNMNDFDNVIIHCLPFNISFGFAPLN